MKLIKSFLIDFDGTLVDSALANALAYKQAIQKLGRVTTEEEILRVCKGHHWSQFLPKLSLMEYSDELGRQIAQEKKVIYPNFFHLVTLNSALINFLSCIPDSKRIIVSNASKASISEILRYFSLVNFFDGIVGQEDFTHPKPSPECYLFALEKFNLDPEQCLSLEDSQSGLTASLAANIATCNIIIPNVKKIRFF
jgi:HAD superfamily hydrolase (TIGR01509 family)